jgi:hypothetical protein
MHSGRIGSTPELESGVDEVLANQNVVLRPSRGQIGTEKAVLTSKQWTYLRKLAEGFGCRLPEKGLCREGVDIALRNVLQDQQPTNIPWESIVDLIELHRGLIIN